MDPVMEQREEVQIEFLRTAPREEDYEILYSGEQLLSPARGLLLGAVVGLVSWLIVGLMAYAFLIHP